MGGGTILRFYGGDTAVMRGDIELMGGSPPVPPTRENPDIICLEVCSDHVDLVSYMKSLSEGYHFYNSEVFP